MNNIKIGYEYLIDKRPDLLIECENKNEEIVKNFVRLCEATAMWDKTGDAFYCAKKVLRMFPYD